MTRLALHTFVLLGLLGCGAEIAPVESSPAPSPSASSTGSVDTPPPSPGVAPDTGTRPQPPVAMPSGDRFRCQLDTGAQPGHRAAWKPIPGATGYRVYETTGDERKLTYESKLPSVFFSTSAWSVTGIEIVWVDGSGAETLIWPEFSQGITMDAFDQLIAVGEDASGPVLQIRDCVRSVEEDYAPELAVRSLRIPGVTELRGVAVHSARRELFLRSSDGVVIVEHFTTAGSKRNDAGEPVLDLASATTSAPLGPGSALSVLQDVLYAADGNTLVRIAHDASGWHETARSAALGAAVEQLETVGLELRIVLADTVTDRVLTATWDAAGLVVSSASPLPPLQGPVLSAVNQGGNVAPALYLAARGRSEIRRPNGSALQLDFPIAGLAAGGDRMYARAEDGAVSSWTIDGAVPTIFRMPVATIHRQLMVPLESFIIE